MTRILDGGANDSWLEARECALIPIDLILALRGDRYGLDK
jgi:hypothetical protein